MGDVKNRCRLCHATLSRSVVDLGGSPLCENFLTAEQLNQAELYYPLQAFVCDQCFLVQVADHVSGEEIFCGEYAYFSSYSDSWLRHAAQYVEMIVDRLNLGEGHRVVEIASNDGYLLKNFVERGIPCLGIEPAENVARAAIKQDVPTEICYFDTAIAGELVRKIGRANLIVANNVLAHVPDIKDFVGGIKLLLAESGVLTVECPHLLRLIEGNQFDTVYQEHYFYFSLHALMNVFGKYDLVVFDVEELPTHGGSLRVFVRHQEDDSKPVTSAVDALHRREVEAGYTSFAVYEAFARQVEETKRGLLSFLIEVKNEGKNVAAYGAPGKGNTLLNYCGIRTDFIDYVVDRNPYKHGKFTPGTHIPIYSPEKLAETKPDYVLILPWNLRDEIAKQLEYTRDWGAQLVVPIPKLSVV